MKITKNTILRNIAVVIVVLGNVCNGYCQSPEEMFRQGLEMTEQALEKSDQKSYTEGIELMEKAQKKDKKRADWCYEIGCKYVRYVSFGGKAHTWNWDKGVKWFKEGAKLGHINSALYLYRQTKPRSEPVSIFDPDKEWKQYFKERDLCWEYAGIALNAEIPSDFNNYLGLADAARFTSNENLALQYTAKAAENKEWGAIDKLIYDERALDYITSPEIMFEAASQMWKRDYNEHGRHDSANGYIWFEKSAKAGYPSAQFQMGYIYLKGWTVKPDTLKAMSWFKLAAKNNVPGAISAMGRLYINGKGIEKDTERGFRLFNESADKDYPDAKLYLAYCHLYGIGTPRDTQQARTWFQKYFDSFKHAPDQRAIVYNNQLIDLDYFLGLTYYYENSAECIPLFEASMNCKGYIKSQRGDLLRKLATCYREGKCGIEKNAAKAEELQKNASNYGSEEITSTNILF